MRAALALALLVAAAPAFAQSPYAGQEGRAIKALTPEEIRELETGAGAGLAKAAELNHYPGPRHVLELADALALTPEQTIEVEQVFQAMDAEARRLGALVLAREAELERLFASGQASAASVLAASRAVGTVRGELRAVHLGAHIAMRDLLTPDQVARYDALRGYSGHARGGHGGNH